MKSPSPGPVAWGWHLLYHRLGLREEMPSNPLPSSGHHVPLIDTSHSHLLSETPNVQPHDKIHTLSLTPLLILAPCNMAGPDSHAEL